MKKRGWTERFTRDVDALLGQGRLPDGTGVPPEYGQVLALAHTLAWTDFSPASQVRQNLRRRLLDHQERIPKGRHRWNYVLHKAFRQRPLVPAIALLLMVLLVVALAWPEALATLAQSLELVLGDHTWARQEDSLETPPAAVQTRVAERTPTVLGDIQIYLEDDSWSIDTPIGGFGGSITPSRPVVMQHFDSIEEAQANFAYTLGRPTYLPTGYALREVIIASPDVVLYFYDGPDQVIILAFMAGANMAGGNGPIEAVDLNGRPAAWIGEKFLLWEVDELSIVVGGPDLGLEEAMRIAESLEWPEQE